MPRTLVAGGAQMFSDVLSRFIRRYVVDEVPDEMSACLDCSATVCSRERYRTCQHRLEVAAWTKAYNEREHQET